MADLTEKTNKLFSIIEIGEDENAFHAADQLAEIGGVEVVNRLVLLLSSENHDAVYLAARALSKCEDNQTVLETVFEIVKNDKDTFRKPILVEALAGFDCSDYFLELFKLYLFGSFKVSAMAKDILDEQEFAITPRVIRKAEKHWHHFKHNTTEENFAVKNQEVTLMFETMKSLFEGEEMDDDEMDEKSEDQ